MDCKYSRNDNNHNTDDDNNNPEKIIGV